MIAGAKELKQQVSVIQRQTTESEIILLLQGSTIAKNKRAFTDGELVKKLFDDYC